MSIYVAETRYLYKLQNTDDPEIFAAKMVCGSGGGKIIFET